MAQGESQFPSRNANPIPQVREPLQQTTSRSPTPSSSKSRLHFLFHWLKSSNAPLRSKTPLSDERIHKSQNSASSTLRPALSTRSRSANADWTRHERHPNSEKRPELRDKIASDPPPLIQVHGQSILHASIEVPTSFIEKPRSRRASWSKDISGCESAEDTVEVKRSHKKTESGQSSCSTKSKLVFLIHGPYILQYSGDSEGDALPEKILVLDRESVAFACDAVPGRPWVLQVSRNGSPTTKSAGQTLKPSWSRLTLRQMEPKRTVNTLLLVFNDSEELYTWLFAIRKEIEHLGGLEYRPNAEEDDQSWRNNLTKKFASPSEQHLPSRTTSTSETATPAASPPKPTISRKASKRTPKRSLSNRSSASSQNTSTSLERLRDSVTSDGYQSTVATSSGETSAPSNSPMSEQFPSINSVTDTSKGSLSLRAYSLTSGNTNQQSTCPARGKSILERRKLSVSSLQLLQQEGANARKIIPDLPSTITGSPNSVSPKLATPPPKSPLRREKIILSSSKNASPERKCEQPHGATAHKQPSEAEISSIPKAKYSLFPARPPPEPKTEPVANPATWIPPNASAQPAKSVKPKEDKESIDDAPHKRSRSRTVTLELRQHRVSALLGAGDFDLPQRSPAVTDDMIMCNFGVARNEPPPSPMPKIRVPGLSDLKIDLSFLNTPYNDQQGKQKALLESKRISKARRISIVHGDALTAVPKAPIGPPPSGPLPAVPPSVGRKSSRNTRSSRCSHSSTYSISDKSVQQTPLDPKLLPNLRKEDTNTPDPPSYEMATGKSQKRHRRTISSSIDGPPPPNRMSSRSQDEAKIQSQSCSRGRRKADEAHE